MYIDSMVARTLSAVVIVAVLGFLGCPQPQPIPEPQPAVITDSDSCGPACSRLMELGCEEGMPIEVACEPNELLCDGARTRLANCSEVCHNTQDNGVWLNPKCVMNISSCSQVESCALKK